MKKLFSLLVFASFIILFIGSFFAYNYYNQARNQAVTEVATAEKTIAKAHSYSAEIPVGTIQDVNQYKTDLNSYSFWKWPDILVAAKQINVRISLDIQNSFKKNIGVSVSSFSKEIEASSVPTKSLYKQNLNEISESVSATSSIDDVYNTRQQIQFLQNKLANENVLVSKSPFFEKVDSVRKKSQEYQPYFAALEGYQTEKTAIVEIENVSNEIYRQKFNSSVSANDIQTKIDSELQPKLDLLQKSYNTREQDIKKREEERRQFLRARAQQDIRNKALNVQAPAAVLPNLPKFIYISTINQSMYSYEYGIAIQSAPVVTGKPGFETPHGRFSIYKKERNAILRSPFDDIQYSVPVSYWMPFYSGYGIHDAPWRTYFGGRIYKTSGSHGCVNTPANVAAWMFGWAEVGTVVVVGR